MSKFGFPKYLKYGSSSDVVSTQLISEDRPSGIVRPKLYGRDRFPLSDLPIGSLNRSRPLYLHSVRDAVCLPNNVFLSKDYEVLAPSFIRRRFSTHGGLQYCESSSRYELLQPPTAAPVELDDELVVSIDTDRPSVYGHVLLETYSRLWALRHISAEVPFRVVTSTNLNEGSHAIFELFGIPADRLIQLDAPIRCRKIVIPDISFQRRHYIHSEFFRVVERIKLLGRRSSAIVPKKIYISRSKLPGRKLINELEVEDYLSKQGYTIMHPQDMPLIDQVKIYSKTREIISVGGSAAHNAIFAKPSTKVLILSSSGWFVNADILFNRKKGKLGYCFGDPLQHQGKQHRTQSDWSIDMDDLASAHAQHFGARRWYLAR